MNVVLTEAAVGDLVRIGRFIGQDNPARAASFVAELEKRCQNLGFMPQAFPLLPGRETSGIRRRPYGDYLIFYRLQAERTEVLRVLNGAQDYEAILFPVD
ncbi:type II toxin-antitoxin system RelE/ParE family toxin [Methylorubrum aminovorans]|uniref:type II toxin-antitoxin system RelE/ParE family toxin n=1 Tax=Methylorubrum aminovorans TaxID=269069 RepID=UPI003C2DF7A0